MARPTWHLLHAVLRRRKPLADAEPVADAGLLARFTADRDEAAFELLVWRHGGMVLDTCRRVLTDDHAAEDAFQAVFLILARKASSVRKSASVAGWLHRVAVRVAVRARNRKPATVPLSADPPSPSGADLADWKPILDEEVARLPERFRLPVVLCYLAGHSTEDAARRLGCPRGTVLSRLATARSKLAARLTRRGVTLPASVAAVGTISSDLVTASVRQSIRFLTAAAGDPFPAAQLAEGVLRMTAWKQTAAITVALVVTAGLGTGLGVVASEQQKKGDPPTKTADATKPAEKQPEKPSEEDLRREQLQVERAKRLDLLRHRMQELQRKLQLDEEKVQILQADGFDVARTRAARESLADLEQALFRSRMELLEATITEKHLRAKLKQIESVSPDEYAISRLVAADPAVQSAAKHVATLSEALERLREKVGENHPSLREAKSRLDAALADRESKTAFAYPKQVQAWRSVRTESLRQKLDDMSEVKEKKQAMMEALSGRLGELQKQVSRSARSEGQIENLLTGIGGKRELLRTLSMAVLRAELELDDVREIDPADRNSKLDRILTDLAELRQEVKKLREQSR